jgi:beta-lactamase class D
MKTWLVLVVLLTNNILPQTPNWDSVKVSQMFGANKGTMVVYNNATREYYKFNSKRSAERFVPASTFKIPNSLIGLETGIITDENFVIKWDGIERDNKEWNRDHSLATAIKYSVVPYYQELARRVGRNKYEKIFSTFDYGNKKIGERIDYFWLDNSLKISADEQILFLKNFYEDKLPFSLRNIEIVKKIMSQEKYEQSVLKYKTGTGMKEDKTWIGWLVGYVIHKNNVFFYAFNVDGKTYDEAKNVRDTLPRVILKDFGFIR